MDLQEKVRETVQKYGLVEKGDGVLVAVSGGPDSVALLHFLFEIKDKLGLRLEVAHLQHGMRGEEAQRDAVFVAAMAQRFGLPFHLKEINLPALRLRRGKGNLEAMAREERYRYFACMAKDRGVAKIATGHTRDDQVETLLMWLLRGSGRKGLGGMASISRLSPLTGAVSPKPMVIRPLIDTSKAEVIDYLTERGLEYRTDRTNEDPTLLRNWIRTVLLPLLRERIDSRLDLRLSLLAELMRDEEVLLEGLGRKYLAEVRAGENIERYTFLRKDKAIQRRLLRLWIEETLGDLRRFDFHHVEEAIRIIAQGPPQSRLSLPRGWDMVRDYDAIRLEKRKRKIKPVCYSYSLCHDGELDILEAGVRIQSQRLLTAPAGLPKDPGEAFFDLSSLPRELTVRNFRPGDRFQPLGMQGHKKLKDLFIEKRISLSIRSRLPLLLAGEEILWIPGYARSEFAKIVPETKGILRVKVHPCGR